MAEIWDLYTNHREKTGRNHLRGNPIPQGLYHLVVHVWIRNRQGQYLISQRAANRPTFPLMWECVGGSVVKGESSLEGALREVREKVGISLNRAQGKLLFSKVRNVIEKKAFQDIVDVWLFSYDEAIPTEQAPSEEVACCKWMFPHEVRQLYDEGKLVPTLDYFFCVLEAPEPDYANILGKTVKGKIDRPLGSRHPKHPDILYPVNYGYVEGVLGGDGEPQDVYVLGTDKPISQFEGKVIRVYHRFDDIEDKWIVSLDGSDIPDERILGDIAFQEQFFSGKLFG